MPFRETIAVYCAVRKRMPLNTLCEQIAEVGNAKSVVHIVTSMQIGSHRAACGWKWLSQNKVHEAHWAAVMT
jgi:hypothetical protein